MNVIIFTDFSDCWLRFMGNCISKEKIRQSQQTKKFYVKKFHFFLLRNDFFFHWKAEENVLSKNSFFFIENSRSFKPLIWEGLSRLGLKKFFHCLNKKKTNLRSMQKCPKKTHNRRKVQKFRLTLKTVDSSNGCEVVLIQNCLPIEWLWGTSSTTSIWLHWVPSSKGHSTNTSARGWRNLSWLAKMLQRNKNKN